MRTTIQSTALAVALMGAGILGSSIFGSFAASAAPIPGHPQTMRTVVPAQLETVQWRGGYHGGWHRGGWGWRGAPFVGGLAAGAILGGALAYGAYGPPPAYYVPPPTPYADTYVDNYDYGAYAGGYAGGGDPTAYCLQRYRSYDPASGTYLGYDGQRHPCP